MTIICWLVGWEQEKEEEEAGKSCFKVAIKFA